MIQTIQINVNSWKNVAFFVDRDIKEFITKYNFEFRTWAVNNLQPRLVLSQSLQNKLIDMHAYDMKDVKTAISLAQLVYLFDDVMDRTKEHSADMKSDDWVAEFLNEKLLSDKLDGYVIKKNENRFDYRRDNLFLGSGPRSAYKDDNNIPESPPMSDIHREILNFVASSQKQEGDKSYRGVYFDLDKSKHYAIFDGCHLGFFDREVDAAHEYDIAVIEAESRSPLNFSSAAWAEEYNNMIAERTARISQSKQPEQLDAVVESNHSGYDVALILNPVTNMVEEASGILVNQDNLFIVNMRKYRKRVIYLPED